MSEYWISTELRLYFNDFITNTKRNISYLFKFKKLTGNIYTLKTFNGISCMR